MEHFSDAHISYAYVAEQDFFMTIILEKDRRFLEKNSSR